LQRTIANETLKVKSIPIFMHDNKILNLALFQLNQNY